LPIANLVFGFWSSVLKELTSPEGETQTKEHEAKARNQIGNWQSEIGNQL